ncbi:porin [Flavobacterium agricola]|uniref:Porin n=1 Tax=Flavobacterium agricola TaxID=2870839 RepID=A0ABY6M1T4_9FLAO|nr:porin [Flavobacterium agricola]UYW00833.1 porin [Flavobacterium agricola]
MKKIYLLGASLLLLFQFDAYAQEETDPDEVSLKIISTRKPGLKIVEDFNETTGQHYRDPKAPRFLLYDQKREIAFGVGGFVRVRTAYDFGGSPTSDFGFVPATIPVPTDLLTKNRFNMDASKSTLFFKLLGNNDKVGQFQAYVAGRFSGAGGAFVLTDAYVTLLGFTVGRTWSTFNDLAAVPPTIDFQGPNGAAEMRTTQIRYTGDFGKGFSYAVAAEMPNTTGTYAPTQTVETTQRIPDIPVYVQYNWGEKKASHVRAAGVMRNMNYRDVINNTTETETSFGMQLSTNVELTSFMEFYGQITYGKGIAQYINDLSGRGLSLIQNPSKPGKMQAQEALGWFAQIQFNLSKDVYATAGYSQAEVFPDQLTVPDSNYRYGQYIVGNVFYNLTTDFKVGVEYLWGDRVNIDGASASANRVQTLIQFNF